MKENCSCIAALASLTIAVICLSVLLALSNQALRDTVYNALTGNG